MTVDYGTGITYTNPLSFFVEKSTSQLGSFDIIVFYVISLPTLYTTPYPYTKEKCRADISIIGFN